MKKYDYKKAYNYIESHKEEISKVWLGIHEDWFWTCETVWKNGKYEVDLLSTNLKIASIELQEVKQMKFRVGDIIKGTDKDRYAYTNTGMTKGRVIKVYDGASKGESDIRIEILEHTSGHLVGDEFDVESKYFELVPQFGKSDLKTGWRVFTRNSLEYVVIKDTAETEGTFAGLGREGGCPIACYKNDLTTNLSRLDIVAVYEPTSKEFILADFDEEHFKLVWKRKEEPIEITIKEIADWKGVSPERIRIRED